MFRPQKWFATLYFVYYIYLNEVKEKKANDTHTNFYIPFESSIYMNYDECL